MPRTGRPATRHVAAVERAIAVLDALAEGELGTNEVARRTGLTASTASRQLATLAAGGLVEHAPGSGAYRLGRRLVALGNVALGRLDLRELARSHLRALVAETSETATLSVPGRSEAVTVDFVQSPLSVRSVAELGRPSIGHATAAGKVVLAYDGDGSGGRLERFTRRTITDRQRLERELRRVRSRGWAEAVEEREPGLAAIAAPVLAAELVAVLGIQGPSERLDAAGRAAAVPRLLAAARALARELG